MTRAIAAAGLLFVLCAPMPALARLQDAGKPSSQDQESSSTASTPGAKPAKPRPKKVWTNDNVSDVGGTISVVGSPSNGTGGSAAARSSGNNLKGQPKPTNATKASIDPKVVAQLRDQLQRLQSQLAIVERQLSDLKGASKGDSKNTGGVRQDTWSYDSSSVEEQIQHLQEKKKRIEATIDELFDAARKAGIEPGDLR
jgi:hypothetical protein